MTEYEWDYRNRLVKVTDKNSHGTTTQVVEYTYDVFDRRIVKEVNASSPFDMADAAIGTTCTTTSTRAWPLSTAATWCWTSPIPTAAVLRPWPMKEMKTHLDWGTWRVMS